MLETGGQRYGNFSNLTLVRTPVWYDTRLMMMLAHGMPGSEPAATFALVEHLIKVGVPVCQALLAYGKQQYDETVKPKNLRMTVHSVRQSEKDD